MGKGSVNRPRNVGGPTYREWEVDREWGPVEYEQEVKAAWRRFRQWLGDRVDALDGGIRIAWGVDLEHYADVYADARSGVSVSTASGRIDGEFARAECDKIAALVVGELRQHVPHPTFLQVEGAEWTDPLAPAARPDLDVEPVEPLAVSVRSADHLQELVEDAVEQLTDEPLIHDRHGDVTMRAGWTVLFISVADDDPVVRLEAHLVKDVRARDRLGFELNRLNTVYPFTFLYEDGLVKMVERVVAQPFAPAQLRSVVAEMLVSAEEVSEALAARLDGMELLATERPVRLVPSLRPTLPDPHSSLLTLVELLHAGVPTPAEVAQLFGRDRGLLTQQIGVLRDFGVVCPVDLQPAGLRVMRQALHVVVAAEAAEAAHDAQPGRRRGSQQLTLLPDEETLDGGVWDAS